MKLHDYRSLCITAAGSALLLSSLGVSAKETSLADLTAQKSTALEYGTAARDTSIQKLFGFDVTASRGGGICGDSEPDEGEQCDDGNTVSGDGCSSTCQIEAGFECAPAVPGESTLSVLGDGSFELNDGSWAIGGWAAGRCSGPTCVNGGTNFASDGEFWIWIGGVGDTANTGTAVQTLDIPANATTLTFDVLSAANGCGDSTVNVQINGTPVWAFEDLGLGECVTAAPFNYVPVSVDISAFAGTTGAVITLLGDYVPAGGGSNANWFVDNFRLDVPLVPPVPPVPSACQAIVCGDGIQSGQDPRFVTNAPEACDDGNLMAGDGCSASCVVEQPNFVCDDANPPADNGQAITDSGLEAGRANPFWVQSEADDVVTQFEPICSEIFCGASIANDGAWYAWFGGSSLPNNQTLAQTLTIPATATDLQFDMLIGVCDSDNDFLAVDVDSTNVYMQPCTPAAENEFSSYKTVFIDISAFADGMEHTVTLTGNTVATNGGNSNYFVDNIGISTNAPFAGEPSACFELNTAVVPAEEFEAGIPAGWTIINLSADSSDGWGTTDDGICGSQNWAGGNITGGGGIAACADSDATGQIDIDAGDGMGGDGTPTEMDSYLCTPSIDLSSGDDTTLSFLVNFQSANNDLNDNGTPDDTSDDFDDDFLEIVVGTAVPNALTIPSYSSLGNVFDHLDSSLEDSPEAALAGDLSEFTGEAQVFACFHYRGTYSWYAQVDNVAVREAPVPDSDGDGFGDDVDNCTLTSNPMQTDADGDGYGNACDADLNNDCIVNFLDLGIFRTLFFLPNNQADLDESGVTNFVDLGIFRQLFFQAPGPSPADPCVVPMN